MTDKELTEQINQLVEKFPNNMELGTAVRKLYWEARDLQDKDKENYSKILMKSK